eukprot:3302258-Prymnesium_polylepis.1
MKEPPYRARRNTGWQHQPSKSKPAREGEQGRRRRAGCGARSARVGAKRVCVPRPGGRRPCVGCRRPRPCPSRSSRSWPPPTSSGTARAMGGTPRSIDAQSAAAPNSTKEGRDGREASHAQSALKQHSIKQSSAQSPLTQALNRLPVP